MRQRWAWRLRVATTACLVSCGLAGCWDEIALASRAPAIVVYVAASKKPDLRWTFFFPNPTVIAGSVTNISSQEQLYTRTAIAPSLTKAKQDVEARLDRQVYLGQLQVLTFASNVTANQMTGTITEYNRHARWPTTAFVMAEPPGKSPLPVSTHEPIPDIYYAEYYSCRTCKALDLSKTEWQVWDDTASPGVSPTMPFASQPGTANLLAVYPQVGPPFIWSRGQTVGWAILRNHTQGLTTVADSRLGQFVVANVRTKSQVTIELHHRWLTANVRVRVNGNLEKWPRTGQLPHHQVGAMEAVLSHQVATYCQQAIQRADATKTDPFGWGRDYLFSHSPLNIQYANDAGRVWPIEAHVQVTSRLNVVGASS